MLISTPQAFIFNLRGMIKRLQIKEYFQKLYFQFAVVISDFKKGMKLITLLI